MLRAVYTVLDALLQRPAWRANETAVTAVCEVYGHVMCAVKVRPPLTTPASQTLVAAQITVCPGCPCAQPEHGADGTRLQCRFGKPQVLLFASIIGPLRIFSASDACVK